MVDAARDGINVDTVTPWLAANVAGFTPPFTSRVIAGGHSNLTFHLTDASGKEYVLRRPPLSHTLASAHDMGREHRIIYALRNTNVPVAPALAMCNDPAVNGAPFYVMGFVKGHVVRDAVIAEKVLTEKARRTASESLIDTMAAIHSVNLDAVGVGTRSSTRRRRAIFRSSTKCTTHCRLASPNKAQPPSCTATTDSTTAS
jgi:aminoglycoside phosphotransferase (APT) family kinase protein